MDKLANTGEAVIIDTGEGYDIHPKNKQAVGRRLARWALAKDYGVDIPCQSPRYKSMEKSGNTITLTFDHVGNGWRPFDVRRATWICDRRRRQESSSGPVPRFSKMARSRFSVIRSPILSPFATVGPRTLLSTCSTMPVCR